MQVGREVDDLDGRARVRNRDRHIARLHHAGVAVQRLGRMDVRRRSARARERRGHLAPDVPGLSETGDHDASGCRGEQIGSLTEVRPEFLCGCPDRRCLGQQGLPRNGQQWIICHRDLAFKERSSRAPRARSCPRAEAPMRQVPPGYVAPGRTASPPCFHNDCHTKVPTDRSTKLLSCRHDEPRRYAAATVARFELASAYRGKPGTSPVSRSATSSSPTRGSAVSIAIATSHTGACGSPSTCQSSDMSTYSGAKRNLQSTLIGSSPRGTSGSDNRRESPLSTTLSAAPAGSVLAKLPTARYGAVLRASSSSTRRHPRCDFTSMERMRACGAVCRSSRYCLVLTIRPVVTRFWFRSSGRRNNPPWPHPAPLT